tara:strand:- start:2804 stop:3520 length:717 start_codon:yes stop_codon:yes gene_type:complete
MKKFATILLTCLFFTGNAFAGGTVTNSGTTGTSSGTNTQSNASGSNTTITGGYSSNTETTYSGAHTEDSTSTSTSTTNNNSTIPVNSANAPSFSAMSQDVCSMGVSGSFSSPVFGFSGGKHVRDLNCERIKLSKVLHDFGMKVASVSILCQDERVFEAMQMAGTPCPFEGKIGQEALDAWKKYDIERPDYETYVAKLESRSRIDDELKRIEEEKIEEEEAQLEKTTRLKKKFSDVVNK